MEPGINAEWAGTIVAIVVAIGGFLYTVIRVCNAYCKWHNCFILKACKSDDDIYVLLVREPVGTISQILNVFRSWCHLRKRRNFDVLKVEIIRTPEPKVHMMYQPKFRNLFRTRRISFYFVQGDRVAYMPAMEGSCDLSNFTVTDNGVKPADESTPADWKIDPIAASYYKTNADDHLLKTLRKNPEFFSSSSKFEFLFDEDGGKKARKIFRRDLSGIDKNKERANAAAEMLLALLHPLSMAKLIAVIGLQRFKDKVLPQICSILKRTAADQGSDSASKAFFNLLLAHLMLSKETYDGFWQESRVMGVSYPPFKQIKKLHFAYSENQREEAKYPDLYPLSIFGILDMFEKAIEQMNFEVPASILTSLNKVPKWKPDALKDVCRGLVLGVLCYKKDNRPLEYGQEGIAFWLDHSAGIVDISDALRVHRQGRLSPREKLRIFLELRKIFVCPLIQLEQPEFKRNGKFNEISLNRFEYMARECNTDSGLNFRKCVTEPEKLPSACITCTPGDGSWRSDLWWISKLNRGAAGGEEEKHQANNAVIMNEVAPEDAPLLGQSNGAPGYGDVMSMNDPDRENSEEESVTQPLLGKLNDAPGHGCVSPKERDVEACLE